MPLQLTVHHGLPYLLLEIKGTAHLADGLGVMAFAAAACGAATYQRCLLDFRETQVSWTFTEHLQWGASAGETLRNLEKVASVVPPSQRVGTSEKAAQRTGIRLRTFMDIDDAKAWLGT